VKSAQLGGNPVQQDADFTATAGLWVTVSIVSV